jgi:hypothetical protein
LKSAKSTPADEEEAAFILRPMMRLCLSSEQLTATGLGGLI